MPSGLVAWWPANGHAQDIIGGANGVLTNGANFASGEAGQGFSLGVDHAGVLVGNPASLQLQDFTIEAWVQRGSASFVTDDPTSYAGGGAVFCYGDHGYTLGLSGDGTAVLSKVDVDGVYSSFHVTDTQWHHLAVTTSGGTVVFYLDGVAYPAGSYNRTYEFYTPAAIGVRGDTVNGDNNASFFGTIDELAIYSRGLAATEISALYSAGSAGKCVPPPSILTQPNAQSVVAGENVNLAVTAAGSPPLSYLWRFNGATLSDNGNVTGSTTKQLTLTGVRFSQAGGYSVVVGNSYGAVTSVVANLSITNTACATPPSGLLAIWPAEGSANELLAGGGGTLQNGATLASGEVGQGFALSGASQYVQTPHDSRWAFGTQSFSLELWASFADASGSPVFLSSDAGPGNQNKWIFLLNSGKLQFHINGENGSVFIGTRHLLTYAQPVVSSGGDSAGEHLHVLRRWEYGVHQHGQPCHSRLGLPPDDRSSGGRLLL